MSHCLLTNNFRFTYKSLPKHASKSKNKTKNEDKETSLCACVEGSLTLEVAMVIPLVVTFLICSLFFFRVLQVETAIDESLVYAGRMTAVECSAIDNHSVGLLSSEVLFRKELSKYPIVDQFVKGGGLGVSLLNSKFDGDYVELCAEYKMKFPITLLKVRDLALVQRSFQHKWIGKSVDEEGDLDPYVYVAATGSVYHTSASCHYIDLSIKEVEYCKIGALRNLDGHKYNYCHCAVANIHKLGRVYVTNYGTLYHASLNCSGIKRTVKMVRKSETGGLPACSKCGGSEVG